MTFICLIQPSAERNAIGLPSAPGTTTDLMACLAYQRQVTWTA